jgi:hypothetical protein
LELEIWSFFGAWSLELGALVRAVLPEKSEEPSFPNTMETEPLPKLHRHKRLSGYSFTNYVFIAKAS